MRADTYVWIGTALNSTTGYSVRALYAEGVNTRDKLQMRQTHSIKPPITVAIETACSAKCLLGCTHLQYSVPPLQIEDTRLKVRISSKFGTCGLYATYRYIENYP